MARNYPETLIDRFDRKGFVLGKSLQRRLLRRLMAGDDASRSTSVVVHRAESEEESPIICLEFVGAAGRTRPIRRQIVRDPTTIKFSFDPAQIVEEDVDLPMLSPRGFERHQQGLDALLRAQRSNARFAGK